MMDTSSLMALPRDLFIEAVLKASTAEELPNSSAHRSMQLLCSWWNNVAPPHLRYALSAEVWVLNSEEQMAMTGYYETPPAELDFLDRFRTAIAAVTPDIVVMFYGPPVVEGMWLRTRTVDGKAVDDFGANSDLDTAWYNLWGFEHFPTRFPDHWRSLVEDPSA